MADKLDLPPIAAATVRHLDAPTDYAELYLTDLRIRARPAGRITAAASFVPYNYAAGQAMPGGEPVDVLIADLREKAAAHPRVAQMLAHTLAVLQDLYLQAEWTSAREAAVLEGQTDLDAFDAALAEINARLDAPL